MARAMNLARTGMQLGKCTPLWRNLGVSPLACFSSHGQIERDLSGIFENYPSKFDTTHTVAGAIQEFQHIESGSRCTEANVTIHGRITAKRDASNKLCFYDVTSDGATIQIMASKSHFDETRTISFKRMNAALHRGDIVGIRGFPGKSNKGELSIFPHSITLLAPCSENLPLPGTLTDPDVRHRQRYLDLLSNSTSWRGGAPAQSSEAAASSPGSTADKTVGSKQWRSSWLPSAPCATSDSTGPAGHPQRARGARDTLLMRSKVISNIRRFFEDDGFMEVETPVLFPSAGGATAKSFVTHMDAYDTAMHLRIAPELFLKQLVVGGFERVFEIGKVFRNEGVSPVHHPEFTSVESYQAYTDVRGVMHMTQRLLAHVCTAALGCSQAPLRPSFMTEAARAWAHGQGGAGGGIMVDFAQPFAELHIPTELGKILGRPLPDSRSASAAQELLQLCRQHGVPVAEPHTAARLLDAMIGHWLEPQCIQPTFITGHPVALSPLAKQEHPESDCTERFELFVGGREIANAYSELNDPEEQARRFEAQSSAREEGGDEEAHGKDDDFVAALRHGLPPTGGFGLGIDRFVMLLTGAEHLRDVLAFPINRPREQ